MRSIIRSVDVILSSLVPLALLVAIGAALLHFGLYDDTVRLSLDRLTYWVCLPAMIIHSLLDAPTDGLGDSGWMTVAMAIATLGGMALAVLIAWAVRMKRDVAGVFAQAAMRGNLAFVGLPVIALVVNGDPTTIAKASLVLAPTMFLFNVLGVLVLVGAKHYGHADAKLGATTRMLWRSLVTNPLLIASATGIALWWHGVKIGQVPMITLSLLAEPAAPLALLSLGGAMVVHPVHGRLGLAVGGALIKCGVVPLIAYGCCVLLGIEGVDRQVVLVFAATPTAVASYVLATQLGGDEPLAAAGIVVSTILSAASLAAVLALG
jgi:predicted permease